MPIQRATSPGDLYDEVADHDLVLVPDAPLASALNRRLDHPHLGTFATTPRRLAAGYREESEDRRAFLETVARTDLPWRQVAHLVGEVLQCWDHDGHVDAILEYERFDGDAVRTVVDVVAGLDLTSNRLAAVEIDSERSVAVVGESQLTTLERSILPPEYDAVDPFDDGTFDPPECHVFDSSAALVDALLEAIDPERADDVAVVLDADSEYSPLVESALEAADVPFYGGPGFLDHPDRRGFLQLLRALHAGEGTTVREVRPLLSCLGVDVPVEHDEKHLQSLDLPGIEWLCNLQAAATSPTFAAVADCFEAETGHSIPAVRAELDALGLLSEPATLSAIDDLAYYLDSYEVPVEREDDGVLLADPSSATHVDRPLVFFLGLDERWTQTVQRRPWIDRDAQFDRHLAAFQLLLQSGVERYWFVQDAAGGEPVTPCLYFHELLDGIERFGDLETVDHTRRFPDPGDPFEREPVDVAPGSVESISQSTLNALVNCPRDQLFGQLVDGPDRDYFAVGNLFHDFAEFYATHPDAVAEDDLDDLVELMVEAVDPFHDDDRTPLSRTEYRVGLETIVEFLDDRPPADAPFLTPTAGWGTNAFADHFGREVDSPLTERWFENDDLGLRGKIDLVHAPHRLLDYKSGGLKSARQVVQNAAFDPPADTPNFQALLYLAHWRTVRPDERLEFTFLHFLETLEDAVVGEADLEDALTTVTYYPTTFRAFVGSEAAYEHLLDGYKDCAETFGSLGPDGYCDAMADLSFPETTDTDELREAAFAESFASAVTAAVSEDVSDPAKGCDQAVRALAGVRSRTFFREDVDAFETFVADQVDALNRYRRGDERFPVDGPGGEPHWRWVDHRDMILEGDRA